jgi:hypothetical protein
VIIPKYRKLLLIACYGFTITTQLQRYKKSRPNARENESFFPEIFGGLAELC